MSFRDRMMALAPSPLSGLRIAVCLADEDLSIDWVPRHLNPDIFYHTWDYCEKPANCEGGAIETWFDVETRITGKPAGLDEAQRLYSMMVAAHLRRTSGKDHDVVIMGSSTADMSKVVRPRPNTVYGLVNHHSEAMAFGLSTDFFFADAPTFTKVCDAFRHLPDILSTSLRVATPTAREALYYHCCQIGLEVEPI